MENKWGQMLSLTFLFRSENDQKQHIWQAFLSQQSGKIGNAAPETSKKSEFDIKYSTKKVRKCTIKQMISRVKPLFHWTCWMRVDYKKLDATHLVCELLIPFSVSN